MNSWLEKSKILIIALRKLPSPPFVRAADPQSSSMRTEFVKVVNARYPSIRCRITAPVIRTVLMDLIKIILEVLSIFVILHHRGVVLGGKFLLTSV